MKLFHCETTVISASVTRIGRLGGQHHVHDDVQRVGAVDAGGVDQVGGMVRKCSRSRKIAYGEPNMNGNTNAQNVFRRPELRPSSDTAAPP